MCCVVGRGGGDVIGGGVLCMMCGVVLCYCVDVR